MKEKFFNKIKKVLKGSRGYTLIEVAAVVAVTAILAAVVIPVALGKIEQSRLTTAADDVKALAAAVAGFYADTSVWPAYPTSTDAQNKTNPVDVLLTGGGSNPSTSGAGWDLDADTDDAQDQLVTDVPQYSGWKGPYVDSLADRKDPWGYNYVIWVKAMHTAGNGYGWIISGGPDGDIDTDATGAALSGDDIGTVLYTKQ